ncbi:MAG: protocatechuate 3,4-dioxygenase subunit beta [Actinobacteria bacterium]|nr:protocatechuate 3,4-dioxygenase subunit beta [Actinomycetota bacterium]
MGSQSPLWPAPGSGLALAGYRRDHDEGEPERDWPEYRGTILRHPKRPPVPIPDTLSELTGPLLGADRIGAADFDLTAGLGGEPQGQRIIVHGVVRDGNGHPLPETLVEVWQANAAGRYWHQGDDHPAPLDPHFEGVGRCLTDRDGRYRFLTIRPGAYPWRNHFNAWRPAHIHFSLFGRAFTQRLITQMYFPGDPLFVHDPIFNSIRDPADRRRLIAGFDLEATAHEWALAFRFDIVLRGRARTPFEGAA